MKLVHIDPPHRGTSIHVPTLGCCIGREDDNDLILDDRDVSSYHAKIEQVDGVWRLRDLESTNGSFVNGHRVQESSVLSEGDVIQTGSKRLVFSSHADVQLPPATSEESPDRAASRTGRVPLLAGTLIGLLILMGLGALLIQPDQQQDPPTLAVPEDATWLMLRFERLDVSEQNVFRFYLELDQGVLQAIVDDLANQRQFVRQKQLSKEQLAELERIVLAERFLALEPSATRPKGQQTTALRLTARRGRRGNHIAFVNESTSPDFEIVVEELTAFAEANLDLAAIAISREELLEKAEQRFMHGERLLTERDVHAPNLYLAIEEFKYVLQLLHDLENRPDFYGQALRQKKKAEDLLADELKNLTFRGQTHRRLMEYEQAMAAYRRIVDMVPKRSHPTVDLARKELRRVEHEMNQKRKRK